MPKLRRPEKDLSKSVLIRALTDNYPGLSKIKDDSELFNAILNVVKPHVGHGFSEENYQKFIDMLKDARMRGSIEMQRFLSNYLLAGMGLRVQESAEHVDGLTEDQAAIKKMIEEAGFKVGCVKPSLFEDRLESSLKVIEEGSGLIGKLAGRRPKESFEVSGFVVSLDGDNKSLSIMKKVGLGAIADDGILDIDFGGLPKDVVTKISNEIMDRYNINVRYPSVGG